jgi:hypothetical protein
MKKSVTLAGAAVCGVLGMAGCGDGDATPTPSTAVSGDGDGDGSENESDASVGDVASPVYAIMYEIYDPEGNSNSYLNLVDSLDVEAVDPDQGREFAGGRAFMQTYNEWVFVGEPMAPVVRRYSLSPDGELIDEREISFANYGLDAGYVDAWSANFISEDKAYLLANDAVVIWNPSSMRIVGEIPFPEEFFREGWEWETGSAVLRDGKLYRTIFWTDEDYLEFSEQSLIAVWDVETDQYLGSTLIDRCPGNGNVADMDEDGNIYFSNWIWTIGGTLMFDRAPSCVIKVPTGSDGPDSDWALSYAELSNGHEGAMFSHIEGNQALVSIFDDSRTSFDDMTEPFAYMGSQNWQIWSVDLTTGEGEPLSGLSYNQGAYTQVTIDDRHFIMVPSDDWGKMSFYELVDGEAVPSIEVPGWSFAFAKVRD